jgi:hypothetical protein
MNNSAAAPIPSTIATPQQLLPCEQAPTTPTAGTSRSTTGPDEIRECLTTD